MYYIECNIIHDRKRYVCLYPYESLKNYFISAVPLAMHEDKVDQLINYLESCKNKLEGKELIKFNKSIAYLEKVKAK